MSGINSIFARTSSLMMGDQLLSRLRTTQLELLEVQKRISTGKDVLRPSDDPAHVSSILFLRGMQREREQQDRNLQHALSSLNNIDAALHGATDVLLESKTVALSQIGVGSDENTREAQAEVVDAQLKSILDIANRKINDLALFAGNGGLVRGQQTFEEFLGGIRYNGTRDNLRGDVGLLEAQTFTSNGSDAFGALSTRVKGSIDFDPQAAAAVRINDIGGATLEGVTEGTISVTVNGTAVTVDLTNLDTLDDVTTRVNDAIDSVLVGAGTLAISGESFELTGVGANVVTIADPGTGRTAADLGIELSSTGGVADTGAVLNVKLTEQTALADFGAVVDFASGLTITQGATTKTADFSAATTVQDLINVIDRLNLGLRMEINDAGDGIDLLSEVSGLELSVGENGGTTADDLGIRTYSAVTQLSDFRGGLGIEPVDGEDDIEILLHDGTTFTTNADGLSTVGELITAIDTAATAAGLAVGVDFDVDLATTGNGLVFTDNTAGANDFAIRDTNISLVATQLGIKTNAGAGATITGQDATKVRVENLFTNLIDLRDALANNDESGITLAGSRIESDLDALTQSRATVGIEARRIEDQQIRSVEMSIAEASMLSEIQDADLTEVITRFSQLQTQLQASLQIGSANLQLSLLDFLR